MSTAYLRRLIDGETPSVDEWNAHLIAFHERYENATSGPLSLMRTSTGETSYHIVARRTLELVPAAHAVLDIGCGDGLLLRRFKRTSAHPLELVGIDLCEAELERARAMLDGATFLCGDAREADLGTGRFDAVVSHLALMIASQQKRILARARAAMRDGGVLLVLMEAFPLHPVIGGILGAGVAALRAVREGFAPVIPERESLEDDANLRATLSETGFLGVEIEDYVVRGRFTRAEIWAYAQRVYPFGLLDASLSERVHAAVDTVVTRQLEDDGRVEITFPLRLAIARA